MSNKYRVLSMIGMLGVVFGYGGTINAAETFRVGVVDHKAIVEKTKAGKRAMDALKEFTSSRQRIISADDQELKALDETLKNQESGLSEAAKREKAEQFRNKLEGYQKRIQDFNREIQDRQRKTAEDFQKKIEEATATIAEQAGYAMVFEKGSEETLKIILYNQPAVDLTEMVIREFDRRNK